MSSFDACRIQVSANNVISNARQVLYPAAADHDNRVFLQIVAFAGDVSGDLHTISQPHPRDFAQGGVWLFGRHGCHLNTNSPLKRISKRHLFVSLLDLVKITDQSG